NRPDKLNALNQELLNELHEQLNVYKNDTSVRIVVITGSGEKAFVAGADITEFIDRDSSEGHRLAYEGEERIFSFIENFNKPILAAINGYALGGGLELALSCHLRVASETARFGFPEVSLGLIPGYGGTQRLPNLVGKGRAFEMILSTKLIDAPTALQWGLVNAVVAPQDLLEKTADMAGLLLRQSPAAISRAIIAVNASYSSEADGFKIEKEQFGACFDTDDFKEGVSAFLEKRKAQF
ncbi:enoyl-CoA hydratase-related protein, partial [Flavobacteriaceae bacterium]|nr:enoyl-CoA hydratase-related protein [Flavobacteriaceae bacterium]